jgi:hypothetical protein
MGEYNNMVYPSLQEFYIAKNSFCTGMKRTGSRMYDPILKMYII